MISGDGFRQPEIQEQRICEAKGCGKEKGNMNAPLAQDSADGWSKNEPEAECGADHSHSPGAVFLSCYVSDVGLSSRDVATGNAVENSSHKEHEDRCSES